MSVRKIEKEIAKIAKKLSDPAYANANEAQTQSVFVEKFLQAFGWDTSSFDDVKAQFHAKEVGKTDKIPDYVLLSGGEIRVVIEVKRVGTGLKQFIPSLGTYMERVKPHIGILTNGQQWWFFSWYPKKKEMNKRPFAIIDITDLRLRKEDSFLQYFRQDKFNADFFKAFSHADILSGQAHGTALGLKVDSKVKRHIKKMFFLSCKHYKAPNIPDSNEFTRGADWSRKQIRYLWKYTKYHSRWNFDHGRVRVKPMR